MHIGFQPTARRPQPEIPRPGVYAVGSWLAAWIVCGVLAGCDRGSTAVPAVPPTQTAPPIAAADDTKPAAENPPPRHEPDAPPVAAVRTVLREMEAGRLEALAEFLPASYGRELQSLMQSFVEKTPEDLWRQLQHIGVKAATVLKQQPVTATDNAERTAQLAAALDQLVDDASWDRTRWKEWDLRTLLRGPASTWLAAWQQGTASHATLLAETDLRLVSLEGDAATLELRSALDAEPQTVEFVLIEEKWIPKSLAESWPNTVRSALSRLSQVSDDEFAATARRVAPWLLRIEGTLDQMLQAEQPQEVQLGWWQIQSLLVQGRQELLEPGPAPQVELRLTSELTDDELTELLDQLLAATDHPERAEYLTFPTTTGLVIQLSPVGDIDEFVSRLTFVTVKSHDAAARTVELDRPAKN